MPVILDRPTMTNGSTAISRTQKKLQGLLKCSLPNKYSSFPSAPLVNSPAQREAGVRAAAGVSLSLDASAVSCLDGGIRRLGRELPEKVHRPVKFAKPRYRLSC